MTDATRAGTALVTGASAGLGEVYARRLAARGHGLVLVARRVDRLEKLAAELKEKHGTPSLLLGVDLQAREGPAEVHRRVVEAGLSVELLVNNAGYGNYGLFKDSELEKELGQIDLNIRALVALTRLFLPAMVERRAGTVVQVGSIASFVPVPYMATYAATKAFVLSFTEALSAELDGSGVHLMIVCPGMTRTEFNERSGVESEGVDRLYMTAEAVVDRSLADMDRRRRVSVTGFINKVQVGFADRLPRGWVARVTKKLFEGRARKTGAVQARG